MKRLLLSTTLILGTLTGVKGADLTPASAETIQRSITEVETRVDQLSAKIDGLPTQVASTIDPVNQTIAD